MSTMCETREAIRFEHWMREVEALLEKFGFNTQGIDTGAWRLFFDDDYSPEDAVREDLCNF